MDSTGPTLLSIEASYTSTPEGEAPRAGVSRPRSARGQGVLLDLVGGHAAEPIESILDIGCGRGRWSVALAQRFTARVLAVDLTQERVGATAQAVREAGLEGRGAGCRGLIPH